jgi:hypothetical protein
MSRAIETAIKGAEGEDEPVSTDLGKRRWVGAWTATVERAPKAQRSGHSDFKEPIERQKNRSWMFATTVQMHPHLDAEALDDIVVTFSGQDGVKRQRPGLESWMRKLWRKSRQGNDARQSLCCPERRIWIIRCGEKATPSAGRTHSPRLDQGPLGDPFVAVFPDLLRTRDCGLGTEKQIQVHRMSAASCMSPVTANTRGS